MILSAGLRATGFALTFGSSLLLARWLGPTEFGVYSFLTSIVSWLVLLSTPGLALYFNREASLLDSKGQSEQLAHLAQTACLMATLSASLLSVIAAVCIAAFDADLPSNAAQVLLAVPLMAVMVASASILAGMKRLEVSVIIDSLLRPLLIIGLCFLAVRLGSMSLEPALLAFLMASVVGAGVSIVALRRIAGVVFQPLVSFETLISTIKAIAPFALIALVGLFSLEFVFVLLGVVDTEALAVFRVAFLLASFVSIPLTILGSLAPTYLTRFYERSDWKGLRQFSRRVALAATLCSVMPALALLTLGPQIIAISFGEEYEAAYPLVIILVLGFFLVNPIGLSLQLLYATRFQNEASRVSFIAAGINTLLYCSLIPMFGAKGAAIAFAAGKVLRTSMYALFWRRKLRGLESGSMDAS